jgi:hypothetical protein
MMTICNSNIKPSIHCLMSYLDSSFFQRVQDSTQDSIQEQPSVSSNVSYEGYKATYSRSTMVLFSNKTRTPLAALVFRAKDPGVMSLLTGRPVPPGSQSPDASYFQGMLNMNGQEFEITIANLSPNGMINFNILHTPHRVSEVDPGPAYGVNQLNELHENQVYTIPADQRTGRAMILEGLTKKTESGHSVPMSVCESESKHQGTYFHLSVVPQVDCHFLVDKFKEGTTWKCVSHFVRQVVLPMTKKKSCGPRGIRDGCDGCVGETSRGPINPAASYFFGSRDGGTVNHPQEETDVCPMDFEHEKCVGFVEPNVGQSQCGTIRYGREVTVRTEITGKDYAYDYPSSPATLCLSIYPEMKFLPLENIEQSIIEEMKEWKTNQGKNLICALTMVYKSDVCVIDLESPADTVIIQCGHQCLNSKNVKAIQKCPLCRSPAVSFIRADGLVV